MTPMKVRLSYWDGWVVDIERPDCPTVSYERGTMWLGDEPFCDSGVKDIIEALCKEAEVILSQPVDNPQSVLVIFAGEHETGALRKTYVWVSPTDRMMEILKELEQCLPLL